MTDVQIQGLALGAALVALPIISWGSTSGPDAATIAGALLLVIAMVTLTALRFIETKES